MAVVIKFELPGGIVVPLVPLSAWGRLLRDARTYPLLGVSGLVMTATFAPCGYISPFLHDLGGIEAATLSWRLMWYGTASLAASFVLGWMRPRIAAERLVFTSLVGLALVLLAMHWSAGHLAVLVVVFGLCALAGSMFPPLQQARLIAFAPQASTAMLALNGSAIFARQALGTLIGRRVVQGFGMGALPIAVAGIGLLAALAAVMSRRR